MRFLKMRAYAKLILFDRFLYHEDFESLYTKVRNCPVRNERPDPMSVEQICYSVDFATIWYWKHVQCLQRSAVTACLLREQGVPAEMVIGAQQLPFKAHAWVEVDGQVVNDKPYMREMYAVLDRC